MIVELSDKVNERKSLLKRTAVHSLIAALLAVTVVLMLTTPAAVAAGLAECVDTVVMDVDQCETTPEPCCCEAHSDGTTDQVMGETLHTADAPAMPSMPACNCSMSSSEPTPIVPLAVPAHGASSVIIALNGVYSTSVIAPAGVHDFAMERGPAPSHEGIYLTHCALLR